MLVQTEPHPNPLRLEIITDIKQEAVACVQSKQNLTKKKKSKRITECGNYDVNLVEVTRFQNSVSSKQVALA